MDRKIVNVGKDFSRYPAGRHPADGLYNGQTFREKFLREELKIGNSIQVILDDAISYGSSFLEEAFGGLIREEGISIETLKDCLSFVSADENLIFEIEQYLEDAAIQAGG